MSVIFEKTFSRSNIGTSWPPQIREIDDHIALAHPGCLAWRVCSFSEDGLSLSYTSTWASIAELEAAHTDEIILNNISQINTHCHISNIIESYSIN